MFHKIMVAYDESPEAGRALRESIELAKALQAELTVVTVLEPPPIYYSFATSSIPIVHWTEEKTAKCNAFQSEAKQQAEAEVIRGDEVGSIVEYTRKHHPDLLVLGMRQHKLLLGNTTREIVERAPCALLGIR